MILRNNKFFATLSTGLITFLLTSCGLSTPKETSRELPPIFPDYTNVTLPCNITAPNFEVVNATGIKASVTLNGKPLFEAEGDNAISIDADDWSEALQEAKGKDLSVTVSVWDEQHPDGVTYKPFTLSISSDSIDPYIAYRLIPPGYEEWKRMGIYQRCLENYDESTIINNDQNNRGCVNCHSFCKYSPTQMMFHARGEGGGTVVVKNNIPQKIQLDKLPNGKSGTYPMWHPSGNYIVYSSNTTRQSFYGHSMDKIEVYDLKSDIIIYDIRNQQIISDPRFSTEDEWETFPAFSPDGRWLYFCTAKARQMPMEYKLLKYALVRVPFDAATGQLGEKVDTLYSPSRQGGSVSFPRISPDNRFLLYTEAACATFPIHHKEADIKMIDLNSGKLIDTHIINSNDVDSYHSWSSNGRWVIFSSKRIDGRYTRLFITHLTKDGRFSKPFLLPQKDPEHNHLRLTSYNIPEFIKGKVQLEKDALSKLFKTETPAQQ